MDDIFDYVILRQGTKPKKPVLMRGTPDFAPSALTKSDGELKISTERLNAREVKEIENDPFSTAAPLMPLRLIEPSSKDMNGNGNGPPWGLADIGGLNNKYNGGNTIVAVLDTGIDRNHEAFSHMESTQLVECDFTREGVNDNNGHGTHCAGIIFGGKVGTIQIGIAPKVKKALVGKVLGTNTSTTIMLLDAIRWAVYNGANVISMSLGIDFTAYQRKLTDYGLPTELATSKALEAYGQNVRLFDKLADMLKAEEYLRQPVVLIAAAGNASQRQKNPRHKIHVEPPATADGIISVSAVGKIDGKYYVAPFSNVGATIAGPGVDVISACAGGGLCTMSGTSMATPHVAGAAALWADAVLSGGGRFTSDILETKIKNNAKVLPELDADDVGLGLVQTPQ